MLLTGERLECSARRERRLRRAVGYAASYYSDLQVRGDGRRCYQLASRWPAVMPLTGRSAHSCVVVRGGR